VARQFGLPAGTVRAIDQRYLERWAKNRKKGVLRQMGVDEIYLGKTQKFMTVARIWRLASHYGSARTASKKRSTNSSERN
jgi:hypothetical protein